jgi:hypothetical protein
MASKRTRHDAAAHAHATDIERSEEGPASTTQRSASEKKRKVLATEDAAGDNNSSATDTSRTKVYVPYVFLTEGQNMDTMCPKGGAFISLHAAVRALVGQLNTLWDGYSFLKKQAVNRARKQFQVGSEVSIADVILTSLADAEATDAYPGLSAAQVAMNVIDTFTRTAIDDGGFWCGIAERYLNEEADSASPYTVEDEMDGHGRVPDCSDGVDDNNGDDEEEDDEEEDDKYGEPEEDDAAERSKEQEDVPPKATVYLPFVNYVGFEDVQVSKTLSAGVHACMRSAIRAAVMVLKRLDAIDIGAVNRARSELASEEGAPVDAEDVCIARFEQIRASGKRGRGRTIETPAEAAVEAIREVVTDFDGDFMVTIDVNEGFVVDSLDSTDGAILL